MEWHRMQKIPRSAPPAQSRVMNIGLLRTISSIVLNISKDWESVTPLGNLFQCSVLLTIKWLFHSLWAFRHRDKILLSILFSKLNSLSSFSLFSCEKLCCHLIILVHRCCTPLLDLLQYVHVSFVPGTTDLETAFQVFSQQRGGERKKFFVEQPRMLLAVFDTRVR